MSHVKKEGNANSLRVQLHEEAAPGGYVRVNLLFIAHIGLFLTPSFHYSLFLSSDLRTVCSVDFINVPERPLVSCGLDRVQLDTGWISMLARHSLPTEF
jgi:hypothetical protein